MMNRPNERYTTSRGNVLALSQAIHALGVALLYSPTLRSFCQRLARYFAAISTIDDTRFVEADGAAYLVTHPMVDYSDALYRLPAPLGRCQHLRQ